MSDLFHDPNFLGLVSGVAVFAAVIIVWRNLIERDPLPARLKTLADRRAALQGERRKKTTRRNTGAQQQRTQTIRQIVDWLKLTQGKNVAEIRLKLLRAGYRSRDAIFIYMFAKFAMLGGGAALGSLLFLGMHVGHLEGATNMLALMLTVAAGYMLPDLAIKNQSQKREDELRKALPDALDLMVICAEAGLSLDASFDRVAREIGPNAPELAEEMGITSVELNFLPDRHQALQGLADRVPLQGMMALINTLLQTEKYGTPLAQALRVLSAEMREERMMRAEEKAAKLPAILTVPMIVFILPPLFVVLIGPAALKVMTAMSGGK